MKDYDTTVARIAGNILAGQRGHEAVLPLSKFDAEAVAWSVAMAFAITDEVQEQQHGRATSAIDARIRAADRKARA